MQLPQMSDRYSTFVGRVDPAEFVTEQRDDFDTRPRQFGREVDDEVLFGLGYSQPDRRGGRLLLERYSHFTYAKSERFRAWEGLGLESRFIRNLCVGWDRYVRLLNAPAVFDRHINPA